MSNLTHRPKSYSEAAQILAENLHSPDSKKIGHNTYLVREDEDEILATLHGNKIVRYHSKNGTSVSWSGWVTSTTTNRIHQLIDGRANIIKGYPALDGIVVGSFDWHRVN